jgi:hypothetical protein
MRLIPVGIARTSTTFSELLRRSTTTSPKWMGAKSPGARLCDWERHAARRTKSGPSFSAWSPWAPFLARRFSRQVMGLEP